MMHIVMELHGLGIDVWLKGSKAVGKIRQGEHGRWTIRATLVAGPQFVGPKVKAQLNRTYK